MLGVVAIRGFEACPVLSNVHQVLMVKGAADDRADPHLRSDRGPILPVGPGNATFNMGAAPSSCLSVVTVILYRGIRVPGC